MKEHVKVVWSSRDDAIKCNIWLSFIPEEGAYFIVELWVSGRILSRDTTAINYQQALQVAAQLIEIAEGPGFLYEE